MKKTTPNEIKKPIADALRDNGYVPLPRLWVKAEDMEKIHKIAHAHSAEVHRIRGQIRQDLAPKNHVDVAWASYEKQR
jgi:hypothetical protein